MRGRVVLVAGIVLFAALLSYLVALPSRTAQSMDPCFTNAVVRRNGDVVLDEKVCSNQAALKARITDLKSRKPDCFVSVTSEKGTSIETIEHVAQVLHDMGVSQVGFLTEPNSH